MRFLILGYKNSNHSTTKQKTTEMLNVDFNNHDRINIDFNGTSFHDYTYW